MTVSILSQTDLAALVARLVGEGTEVIAPAASGRDPRRTEYRRIERFEEAALEGPLPRRSLKELFLPPSEVLLRYRQRKDGVELQEVPTTFPPRLVLGARPCDAAGVESLDKVMDWGCRDELWFGRRAATTIVSVACPGVDSACFCTAVGLGPDATRGADAMLVPLGRGAVEPSSIVARRLREAVDAFLSHAEISAANAGEPGDGGSSRGRATAYLARPLTEKGEAFLAGADVVIPDPSEVELADSFQRRARERLANNVAAFGLDPEDRLVSEPGLGVTAADGGELIDRATSGGSHCSAIARLPRWLEKNFGHDLWKTISLPCHGCGACAAVCATCHCFDIVDEHDTCDSGARRRNWDYCQSAKFTVHASGHNPRRSQAERLRQRIMHKFSIYPSRFDAILCTGCARCARACGAGMNLPEILGQLVELAAAPAAGSAP